MPSAQVIDFGPEPLTEAMGKFASGFSDSFFKQQTQKKNEDIFKRIKDSYGPDASPERIFKDILESEGLDQDYKRNLLNEVKEYASLESQKYKTIYQKEMQDLRKEDLKLKRDKAQKGDEISKYQEKNLANQRRRLDLEQQRINQAAEKNTKDLPDLVSKYTNTILKDAEERLPSQDKALLNSRIISNIKDDGMEMDEAFKEALDYVQMKNQIIEEVQIEPKPTRFIGSPNPQEIEQAIEKAYANLDQLYDSGIESQSDLRKIAKKSGWLPQEITVMLQELYRRKGKRVRSTESATKASQEVSGSEQGVAQESGGLDDILFGE